MLTSDELNQVCPTEFNPKLKKVIVYYEEVEGEYPNVVNVHSSQLSKGDLIELFSRCRDFVEDL